MSGRPGLYRARSAARGRHAVTVATWRHNLNLGRYYWRGRQILNQNFSYLKSRTNEGQDKFILEILFWAEIFKNEYLNVSSSEGEMDTDIDSKEWKISSGVSKGKKGDKF